VLVVFVWEGKFGDVLGMDGGWLVSFVFCLALCLCWLRVGFRTDWLAMAVLHRNRRVT
jgi:hypothetical protein